MSPFEIIDNRLASIHRMVIKVGTHLLRGKDGGLNIEVMNQLGSQINEIRRRGIQVILVSSGAVGAGASAMKWEQPPEAISDRQALAAIGQSRLMNRYERIFRGFGIRVAQILLTRDGLDHRQRYLNARSTLESLLKWEVLPIVNENDTVSIEELKFGDNDQLSAMIAGKMDADLLVILTNVGGLFDRPPGESGAERIPLVSSLSDLSIRMEDGKSGSFGIGGMQSKLEAVNIASQAGILTHISDGREAGILLRILDGEKVGTWFTPQEKRLSGRKRWIALGKRLCEGRIMIDAGAVDALRNRGKSLLPSGVISIDGEFQPGDLVLVQSVDLAEVARGLVQYSSEELEKILGKKTGEVSGILGEKQNYEVIHRDDMVVLDEGGGI